METPLKKATRADVAREAKVTETIVSYVVNGNRYVDSEKKRRVLQAIEKLHYQPNSMARVLKGKKSNHILLVADDIQSDHFGKLVSEMDTYAYDMGYFISLCADRDDDDFVERIYSRFFDGIVIGSASFPIANIQKLINAHIPVVLLEIRDYSALHGIFGLVHTGLYEGARTCVRYLSERGRRNILYLDRITREGKASDTSDWRFRGFIDQMTASGLPVRMTNIIAACKTEEEMKERISRLVREEGFVPDGIFGRTDKLACIGMEAMQELGYRVPQDVSVIGFDNSQLSMHTTPSLTTIEIRRKEIAQAIMRMLVILIDHKKTCTQVLEESIETTLLMRESA